MNDGGLAFGQAVVADACAKRSSKSNVESSSQVIQWPSEGCLTSTIADCSVAHSFSFHVKLTFPLDTNLVGYLQSQRIC